MFSDLSKTRKDLFQNGSDCDQTTTHRQRTRLANS